MKALHVGLFSSLGMVLVGGAVFAVTPAGGFSASADKPAAASDEAEPESSAQGGTVTAAAGEAATAFSVPGTLKLEGRVGHKTVRASSPDETFVMLEVTGDSKDSGKAPPVALSLVIDKSGSMRGARHQNALQAAAGAVERLQDGDMVSVVAFDTRTELVVPLTTVNASSRQSILSSIRNIQLGGDTCISCGIEDGLNELKKATTFGQGGSIVSRMVVLSDGDTNNGIRDVAGFRSLAQRAMSSGVNITTIGVDVEFNEKIMSAIAQASNGRHYFVENDRDLARVFDAEAAVLTTSIGNEVVADIDLGPNVELVRVFDRTFTRSGSHLSVPLGTLATGETKTVLVKVRVPKGDAGQVDLASVTLSYRDLTSNKDAKSTGKLALERIANGEVASLDPIVLDRVQRSETANALREANALFSVGKTDEARKRLEQQRATLTTARPAAAKAAPSSRAGDIDKSFAKQEAELDLSIQNFAEPPPATGAQPSPAAPAQERAKKGQVKRNVEQADAFGL